MKWNNNDVKYERGNYEYLIAQYNKSGFWVCLRSNATQQSQKNYFRDLGKVLNAKEIEVKKLYDDNDVQTETDVILFDSWNGNFHFWTCDEDFDVIEKINMNYLDKYLPVPAL